MKRNKLIALLLCLVLLAGCTSVPASELAGKTVTFTDDLGREVTVPYQPKRTAVLIGSFASVWDLAGGTMVATANNAFTDFNLDLGDDVVNLGTTSHASLEKLLNSDPDFVIASCKTRLNLDWKDTLESAGIAVAYFDVSSFDDYLRMLKICTQITGREELYEENGTRVQTQVDAAVARAEENGPTVLYLRGSASNVKVKSSKGSVLGEMLQDLGCVNIADSDSQLLEELSLEKIIQADPEYIFIVKQGNDLDAIEESLRNTLLDHPAWSELTAVKEGRLFYMDPQLYNLKPNNRWGEAYEKLADILYPEQ